MKKIVFLMLLFLAGCKFYSFTGASIPEGAKTVQVNFFVNNAADQVGSVFEPGLDRDFTNAVQEMLLNQTNLELTNVNGHLIYEGEIVEYRVSPMTATAEQTAAQNRITMAVNVRYLNTLNEDDEFEKRFSFFYDFDATVELQSVQAEAHELIFERITQDIFNESLAKW
ncbi:MAG: LptE family protein [Bacteroidetes bacterium]|nr:LptE family protein [Bacteroidota bacterium]MDA0889073.1 LptE family protein [Bacteroidota bacterium]MDA1084968.1 LptE family protein [Bacteroidota bacterium]